MTKKKKPNFQRLLRDWKKYNNIMDGAQSNLLKRTEQYLLSTFKKEDDYIKRYREIRNCFYEVDYHPLETGAYEEKEKWHKCRKIMIEFLENLQNFTQNIV